MEIILLILAIIAIAALAPRYGTDSRDLGRSRPDSYPALSDHGDLGLQLPPMRPHRSDRRDHESLPLKD